MRITTRGMGIGVLGMLLSLTVTAMHAPLVAVQQSVPPEVAQRLAPDCLPRYAAGARQLTLQQPTRIEMVCRVTNPFTESVDYTDAVAGTLGTGARPLEWAAQRGQMTAAGREIRWGGFVLGTGETVSATVMIEVTPTASDAGRPVVLFTNARMAARLSTGGFMEVVLPAITTEAIVGLLSGGFVLSPGAGTAGMTVAVSPRTGTGVDQAESGWLRLLGSIGVSALALAGSAAAVFAMSARPRPALWRRLLAALTDTHAPS